MRLNTDTLSDEGQIGRLITRGLIDVRRGRGTVQHSARITASHAVERFVEEYVARTTAIEDVTMSVIGLGNVIVEMLIMGAGEWVARRVVTLEEQLPLNVLLVLKLFPRVCMAVS